MYYGLSGMQYTLEATPISSGGEGSIYSVVGQSNHLAKIYHPHILKPELEEKLRTMYLNPPGMSVQSQIAWPIDIIYDASKNFVGFLMNKLDVNYTLDQVYKYPATDLASVTLRHKLIIAQNICYVISAVHKAGYIFGDFNPKNIGININSGTVAFFDADTYHFKDHKSGHTYRCGSGFAGYVAPELISSCKQFKAAHPEIMEPYLHASLPTFTYETDNFALAIHIFRLIMNGFTPYNGIPENSRVSQPAIGLGDSAVEQNCYCFAPGKRPMAVAMPEQNSLPQYILDLFTKAFVNGYHSPSLRPNADEWHVALDRFEKELKSCPHDKNHYYYNQLGSCPYCVADRQYEAEINSALGSQAYAGRQGQKQFSSAPIVPPSGGGIQSSTTYTSSTANSSATGSSGSSMSTGTKVLIGVVLAFIVFFFFKVMSNVDRTTVDVISSDFTIAVGQTAEVCINSNARKLTAHYDDCIAVNWNNNKASGNMHFLDVTGVSTGTSVLKISNYDNDSKYDTVSITIVAEGDNTSSDNSEEDNTWPDNSEGGNSQYMDSNIVPLSSLEYWNISNNLSGIGPYSYSSVEDNMGNIYDVHFASDGEWNEYKIDGTFSTFEGRFIIEKEYRSYDTESYLWVYGDEQLLYAATMTGGTKPIDFRVDISGVEILRIKLKSATANGGYEYTDLVNAYLCKNGYSYLGDEIPITNVYPSGATSLASLEWWNQSSYIGPIRTRRITDNVGNDYYEFFSSDSNSWQEYAVEGKYSTFVGRLIIEDKYNHFPDVGYVKVYGDGNVLYYGTVTGQQEPVDFSVDIQGVQYLKVELDSPTRDGGWESTHLVNAYLY